MASLNRVTLVGNLGADAEVNNEITKFRLATSENWTDKGGVKQKRTEWTQCTGFGQRYANLAKYLTKGKLIAVEGSLRTSAYEKDGVKRYTTEVIVSNIELLSSNGDKPETNDDESIPF